MVESRSIVSCAEVAADREWRGLDCRHPLRHPQWGDIALGDGHLPGAVHVHGDRVLFRAPGARLGRHLLPRSTALLRRLGDQGLRRSGAAALPGVRMYLGSRSTGCADLARSVSTGARP